MTTQRPQSTPRRQLLMAGTAGLLAAALPASAQTFPSRPIRLIVPFAPGGPTDSFARLYAANLTRQLGHSVVVENKAGASGVIGTVEGLRSAADGHTLVFGTATTHALYNLIQPKPQYDALSDFALVGVLGGAPVAFAVLPSMPSTIKSVVVASRANPGKYSYGSPGSGTLLHMAAERLIEQTGASITHVPYKGSAPALQDLIGGQIDMTVDTLGGLAPHHRSGRLRIVGIATAKRVAAMPDIPTVAESADLPAPFEAQLWNVVAAPKDTSADVVKVLASATERSMRDPELLAALASQSMYADLHAGHEAAARFIRAERNKWKPIIDGLGNLSGR